MSAEHASSEEMVAVPRMTRFPVELRPPPGFQPDNPATWPQVPGRLEYIDGRLLYMTPSGDIQQDVTCSVAGILDRWLDDHPDFAVGTNEAGMILDGEVRAADVAVWSRQALGPYTGGYRQVPPLLAVEVAGANEGEPDLREKARWYLDHGVTIVWLVLPESREVIVIRADGEQRCCDSHLPEAPELPDLSPEVTRFFRRL